MKLNKHEKTAVNDYTIEFLIEPEELRPAIQSAFRKNAKKYNVPGFRRGKAPRPSRGADQGRAVARAP